MTTHLKKNKKTIVLLPNQRDHINLLHRLLNCRDVELWSEEHEEGLHESNQANRQRGVYNWGKRRSLYKILKKIVQFEQKLEKT